MAWGSRRSWESEGRVWKQVLEERCLGDAGAAAHLNDRPGFPAPHIHSPTGADLKIQI